MFEAIESQFESGTCDNCDCTIVVDIWTDGYYGKRPYIVKSDNGAYSRVCYDCFWKKWYVKYPSQRKSERYLPIGYASY